MTAVKNRTVNMDRFFYWLLKICNVLTALLFALTGTAVLVYGGAVCVLALKNIVAHTVGAEKIIADVMKGVDMVFLGIVIQLLGVGLFELFVRPIKNLPAWLVIQDFDQLKGLLVKSSVLVVTVSFVGKAVSWDGGENILYYGVGIGAIIAALSYFIKVKSIAKNTDEE